MHSPRSHGAFLEETGLGCSIYQKIFQHSLHYQSAWQYLQQLSEIMPAQSWVTSGPRLLQHLLFLLTVLDEPSAAKATLFGLVFLLLFFEEWGQEIHQQSYTALDKSTDGQYSVISWCKRLLEKIKENYYPEWASRAVPEQSEQTSLHAETCYSVKLTLPLLKSTVFQLCKETKPHFHCRPLVFTLRRKDESMTGRLVLTGFLILSCTFPA